MRMHQLFTFAALMWPAVAHALVQQTSRLDAVLDGIEHALSHLDRCARGTRGVPVDRCLESDLAQAVEAATRQYGGAEYRLNRYLTVEVRPYEDLHRPADGRSPGGPGARLLDFLDALRFRYRPEGVDENFEGRKKQKYGKKHKMGMMMAAASIGMTVIGGMFMKMMMGGVSVIAVKAFIIAKIALLLSAIMAIKKLMSGGGGGGFVQPTWGGSGGGNEHGGYRRSYGLADDVHGVSVADTMAYKDQLQSSYNNK